jgi:AraC-like DNA-binding protein
MQPTIRASALRGYEPLVRELGGDPSRTLAGSHLHPALLGSTDAYIPFKSVARVVESTAAELGCPDFSLRLANRQNIEILGPIALIARHSPTSREALHGIAQHLGNYSPALRIGLDEPEREHTRYTFEVLVPGIPSLTQIFQLGLGVSLGVFRLLMGDGFRPLEVAIPHAQPPHAHTYRSFFGCHVQFDSDYAGMRVRNADLDRRRPAHDPQVREHVARYLDAEGPADDDVVALVRHLIKRSLATGHADLCNIAAHLGMHPRTLQRGLEQDNTTFEDLLDDVRRGQALSYLTQSSLTIGQIATMLGYSQQSCLSRASRRWFADSPRAIRRHAQNHRPSAASTDRV